MRDRKEIVDGIEKGTGPMTQVAILSYKAQLAILEVLLDMRDMQKAFNDRLLAPRQEL